MIALDLDSNEGHLFETAGATFGEQVGARMIDAHQTAKRISVAGGTVGGFLVALRLHGCHAAAAEMTAMYKEARVKMTMPFDRGQVALAASDVRRQGRSLADQYGFKPAARFQLAAWRAFTSMVRPRSKRKV